MKRQIILLKYISIILLVLWTLLTVYFLFNQISQEYKQADELALHEALISVKKDLAYRTWVTSHGGVYVPITKRTPPNPYLSHIPNRDVKTDDGQYLTLMNPAYTLSQMMKDYSELYGTKGHITSNKLLNPKNKPDKWEARVLNTIEKTKEPFNEVQIIDEQPYVRLLSPLITEVACLKCHAHQGYQVGDVRGGVSISIPLTPFYDAALSHLKSTGLFIVLIWFIGLSVIMLSYKKILQYVSEKILNYEQHIFSMVDMIENRDSYTAGHTNRVAHYASLIAKEMGYSEEEIERLYRASMVHDIGKISTPDSILLKPGKLTRLEYKLTQDHVVTSYNLLKKVDIFQDIAEIVRHHHEKYDGSGYPQGLTGNQIPMLSQIMSVADAFDAMTTNRIYKGKKTIEVAFKELELLSGKQFNKNIVQSALTALKMITISDSNQQPKNQIEQERFAYFYKDQLTGVYNREYLNFSLVKDDSPSNKYKSFNIIYLNNFNQYNKQHSWDLGSQLLIKIAQKLIQLFPEAIIFRIYGDDFVVLHKEHTEIKEQLTQLNSVLVSTNVSYLNEYVNLLTEKIDSIEDLERWLHN